MSIDDKRQEKKLKDFSKNDPVKIIMGKHKGRKAKFIERLWSTADRPNTLIEFEGGKRISIRSSFITHDKGGSND
jgi:ribosomal protein L24